MNKTQNALAFFRKMKYGSISVILTSVVIVAVVVFNIIFSAFAYADNWYIDLTEHKVYGLTDEGRALLDEVDADVTIHFCAPFDKLETNKYAKMVFEFAKEIASEYENIHYDYIDVAKNPTAVTKYKSATATAITDTHIIVENNSGTQHKVFSLTNMFTFDTENSVVPWAFNGEKKLISGIAQVAQSETPIAYFTNTHGEKLSNSMVELFYDAGYEIRPIDLTKDEIDKRGRIIVISNPIYDFEGISEDTVGRKSEIEKIDDFLDGFGNIIVLSDPEAGELPELEAFLREWGIEFDDSYLRDPSSSIDTQHRALVGEYSLEDTYGGSLVNGVVSVGTPPKTIVRDARPINLLWDYKDGREVSTAIYSSKNAHKYVNGEKVEEGQYSLVAVSREMRYIDNTPHHAFVFAIGSANFAADQYLTQTYGNADILYTFMKATGKVQVPIDLGPKPFEETGLDITTAQARSATIVAAAVIPAVILIAGIAVWIRRKHA